MRASEIPIVMQMFGLPDQIVTDPTLADAADGKFFAANYDRFVRSAMRREMPNAIDAAYWREFTWRTRGVLRIVGSHEA